MELALQNNNIEKKPRKTFFSKPLFFQSLKANWVFWLCLTLANALMIGIINLVMGKANLTRQIDVAAVNNYLQAEGWNWLQALGLFQAMGFNLSRIQAMTTLDMAAIMNDLVYSIAGILLPMIYIIVTSNKLVSSQIDNGSMAYVLSTPTNRHKVIRTQFMFLLVSLTAMFVFVGSVALLTEFIGYGAKSMPLRTLILNVGCFACALAFAGVAFFASCLFSRSRYSIALGGGFCVFCFLANILGLFGSKAFVAMGVGVPAMNVFNYMTILSLFNCESISMFSKWATGVADAECSLIWVWEMLALLVFTVVGYIVGSNIFVKKDLPL